MNTKYQQARNLYFQTDMKQVDIASLLGISDKTLYRWIRQDNWKQMKEAAKQAPLAIVEMLYKQLYDLNYSICTRESAVPSLQEAETTRKLINSIEKLKRQASLSENIQVLMAFTGFLNKIDNELAKQVVVHADHYLKERIGHAPLGFYEEEEDPAEEQQVEQQQQNGPQAAIIKKKNKPLKQPTYSGPVESSKSDTKRDGFESETLSNQSAILNTSQNMNTKNRT